MGGGMGGGIGGTSVAPWGSKAAKAAKAAKEAKVAKEAEEKAIATVATSGNGGPGSAVGGTSGVVVGRKRHPDEGQRIRRLAYFAERLSVAFQTRFNRFLSQVKHTVLCCAVLCCAVLCCAVLCCALLKYCMYAFVW